MVDGLPQTLPEAGNQWHRERIEEPSLHRHYQRYLLGEP